MNLPVNESSKHIVYFISLFALVFSIVNCASTPISEHWCGIKLPFKLSEISGITSYKLGSALAIQDEEGTIYRLFKNGEVEELTDFAEDGDYEGIATTPKGEIWVLRSDGVLYQVVQKKGEYFSKVHEIKFLKNSDSEGLCYDSESNSLLIAVKDNAPDLKNKTKAVYRFSLSTHKIIKTPVFTIDTKDFHKIYGRSSFAPSAITIGKNDQHYYVLSGRSQQIAVVNRSGQVVDGFNLDREKHRQPEGILYDKSSFLIANEGRGKKARIRCWNH
jgi:uncharacterized protein YjiK